MNPPRPPQQNRQQPRPQQNRQRGGGGRGGSPTETPTWQSINRETRAAGRQKYNPVLRAEHAELGASNRRVGEVGNWWDNYLNTVAQGRNETQAAYDKAGQQQQNFINQTGALDSANTQRLQGEANQSAALRGAPTGGTELAGREAAAQNQRQYLSAATGAHTALQGALQYSYLTDQKRIGAGQKIASQEAEQGRGRKIAKDITATKGERGAFEALTRGEKQKAARDYLIQQATVGLDTRKQNQSEREGRFNQGIEGRKMNLAEHPPLSGATPAEQNRHRQAWHDALAASQTLYESRKWDSWAHLTDAVMKHKGVSPAMARRAVERIRRHVEQEERKGESRNNTAEATNHHHP